MLIARCCPIMRVIHLKGGQLGYGGHVVNVAQDITSFAATLPRLGADVFSPWAHTSDGSYIYQLSLVLATATVSYLHHRPYSIPKWVVVGTLRVTEPVLMCHGEHPFSCGALQP